MNQPLAQVWFTISWKQRRNIGKYLYKADTFIYIYIFYYIILYYIILYYIILYYIILYYIILYYIILYYIILYYIILYYIYTWKAKNTKFSGHDGFPGILQSSFPRIVAQFFPLPGPLVLWWSTASTSPLQWLESIAVFLWGNISSPGHTQLYHVIYCIHIYIYILTTHKYIYSIYIYI